MFTKRKLAKLMETKEDKEPIDYDIIEKAKENADWNDVGGVKVIDQRKQKIIISLMIFCVLILLIVGVTLGIVLSTPSDDPLIDLPGIHYSYSEDKLVNYGTMEEYLSRHEVSFKYYKGLNNVEEDVYEYFDEDKSVLFSQEILLLDTYEFIELYVELQSNYIFDFLHIYDRATEKQSINGIDVSYTTEFDEDMYLYKTWTKFSYDKRVYRVYFEMVEETDWQHWISVLI